MKTNKTFYLSDESVKCLDWLSGIHQRLPGNLIEHLILKEAERIYIQENDVYKQSSEDVATNWDRLKEAAAMMKLMNGRR